MMPVLFVLLSLAGGLGAACRFSLDGALRSLQQRLARDQSAKAPGQGWVGALPWPTITINLAGSLALGLATGAAASHLLSDGALLVVGTGFLGGFTTFSTASVETVRLLQDRRVGAACLNGLGVLAATTVLAGLGLWLGAQL